MTPYIPVPDPLTPGWLTAVLRASGALERGEVLAVTSRPTGAFNSRTSHLQLRYSEDATPDLTSNLILKQNIPAPWGVEAGAEEVKFYQLIAALTEPAPAIVPCYAAAYDPASGNSYVLLQDLSATHSHPVTRDQQVSITDAVPPAHAIERVSTRWRSTMPIGGITRCSTATHFMSAIARHFGHPSSGMQLSVSSRYCGATMRRCRRMA